MIVQFNTDKNVKAREAFTAYYTTEIEDQLSRFTDHITRIEVHLSDENGPKEGIDTMRCLLEARVEGRQPIVVSHDANNLDQAVGGALDKLSSSLDRVMGKLSNH